MAQIERPAAARHLLRRAAAPGPDGLIVAVDPASAGWEYLDFAAYRLGAGQRVAQVADNRERLVLVLEGRATVRSGDRDFGTSARARRVFDGPPPPVILVERRSDRSMLVAATDALVAIAASARRPDAAHRAGRARRYPRGERAAPAQTARRIHHLLPPGRRGRPVDRVRGVHARRQLVELSAAQARHGGPADRGPARGALLLPLREARGVRVRSGCTPPTASSTRRSPPGDGDVVLVPAGYHPVERRSRLRLLLPERDGRPEPRLELHRGSGPRLADGLGSRRHRARRRGGPTR